MLVGAAILPSAPVLVPGASPTLDAGTAQVCDAIDAVVDGLPAHDTAVLVAAGAVGRIHARAYASLAGVGRPDIAAQLAVDDDTVKRLAAASRFPVATEAPLPLDLAALALLLGDGPALVPLAVPASAGFDMLAATGVAVAKALDEPDLRGVVVAAGDLSAGLTERSPLHLVTGAEDFDGQVIDAVDAGRLDVLARLGPEEAIRVGARGWAALATLHGALEVTKLGLVRRHYSAPEGVGYVVAHGA